MVRTLACMLCVFKPRPSTRDCEIVAQSLVNKYPFLMSVNSWRTYIYNRCINVNRKADSKEKLPVKQSFQNGKDIVGAPVAELPLLQEMEDEVGVSSQADNEGSEQDDVNANDDFADLTREIIKKPNSSRVKELWKKTYSRRREKILSNPQLVSSLCSKYPLLRRSFYVRADFEQIIDRKNPKDLFKRNWMKWQSCIITYALESKPTTALKSALDDSNPELKALKCLSLFLTKARKPQKAKAKLGGSSVEIPFILCKVPKGTPPNEAIDASNNHPHIILFSDPDDDVVQFFLAVEQTLLYECPSLADSLFMLIAVHYVFNIK